MTQPAGKSFNIWSSAVKSGDRCHHPVRDLSRKRRRLLVNLYNFLVIELNINIGCDLQEMESKKRHAPAADRNKEPILEIVRKYCNSLPNSGGIAQCLEISSGTGHHVVYFAHHFPEIVFQPTEYDRNNLPSIQEYVDESGFTNIRPPLHVDITTDITSWDLPVDLYDLMININMIHITPWQCSLALFQKAGELLKTNGMLLTYGPYARHGVISPESNIRFHNNLLAQNSEWGLRDVDDLEKIASIHHLVLESVEEMPSNNLTLIWRKVASS